MLSYQQALEDLADYSKRIYLLEEKLKRAEAERDEAQKSLKTANCLCDMGLANQDTLKTELAYANLMIEQLRLERTETEAERDALREALEKIVEKYDHWSLAGGVARAALAPSPAGREG